MPSLDELGCAEPEQARAEKAQKIELVPSHAATRFNAGRAGRVPLQPYASDTVEEHGPDRPVSAFMRHQHAINDKRPGQVEGDRYERARADNHGFRPGQRDLRRAHPLDGKAAISGCPCSAALSWP